MSFTSKIGSLASRAYGWSAAVARAVDQYFEYVTLLLPGNGTNGAQNNTFLDGSTNNFTITRNGNTTQGTFSPFSQTGWGNYFNGSSQYLSLANNSVFDFDADPFTIETWFYITGNAAQNGDLLRVATLFCAFPTSGSTANVYNLYLDGNGTTTGTGIGFSKTASGSNVNVSYAATIAQNTWHHVAVVRSSSTTLTLYLNGQQVAQSTSYSGNVNTGGNPISVAQLGYVNYLNRFPGYVSNLRITKGRAVYSGSSYTVPTNPLTRTTGGTNPPQGTECSLLTCQSNRFLDSNGVNTPASSPLTITPNGSPTVVAFSPFNPTASWSAATYGGSGYFDGSLDYLSVAASTSIDLASSDFTIECWAYPGTQTNAVDSVFGYGGFTTMLYRNGTTWSWEVGNGSSANYFTITATVTPNAWQHIALTRSGNTFTFWINGSSAGTNSTANAVGTASKSLTIGYNNTSPSAQYFTGYISNFRIVKGTAVYTSAFTPPTAPLTAITNTSLLLNFTNAGIYDATSKNDLETWGNAQISTSVSKFGGGSLYIANTASSGANKITAPNAGGIFAFGTGDFAIEAWFYLITLPSGLTSPNNEAIFSCGSNGPILTVSGNAPNANKVIFASYGGTLTIVSTNTVSAGVWYYVAVSRASGTTRMYINGALEGTSTVVEALNASNVITIGQDPAGNNQAFNGYIDDLRITKGNARGYTGSTIDVPTAAFPTL